MVNKVLLGTGLLGLVVITGFFFRSFNELALDSNRQLSAVYDFNGNLVAYYTFDDGTATDSSGRGNNGTLQGGAGSVSGKIGQAVSLDGVDDYVNVPDSSSLDVGDNYTIAFWIKRGRTSVDPYEVVLSKGPSAPVVAFGGASLLPQGQVVLCNYGLGCPVNSSNQISDTGSWHHITIIKNGATSKVYIDGSDVSVSSTNSTSQNNTYDLHIGAESGPSAPVASQYTQAVIDDVRIYNRALSDAEVSQLYSFTGSSSGGTSPSTPPSSTAVSGSCGSTQNSCTSGSLSDTADSSTQYLWSCVGSNGGSTASCSANIPVQTSPAGAINCDWNTLNAAVANASRGATIVCNDGSWSYTSPITLTKGITLKSLHGRDSTTISGGGSLINIIPDATAIANDETIRVEGFTFNGNNSALNLVTVRGSGASGSKPFKNIAIGHNLFKNTGTTASGSGAVRINGQVRGAIFDNIFDRCNVVLKNLGNDDKTEWANGHFPFAYGNSDNLFFENNTIQFSTSFTGDASGWIESGQGGRIVVRYNTWDMANTSNPDLFDVHGFQNWYAGQDGQTGTMITEYYGNTMRNVNAYRWVAHRGSWGLYHNNISTGAGAMTFAMMQYGAAASAGNTSPGCTINVPGASGVYKTEVNNTYVFNNTQNGSLLNMSPWFTDGCGVSGENVGYWNYNASFNGTTGLGRGTSAPGGSCTVGTAFWKNSNPNPTADPNVIQAGTMYKCTSTNTWTPYYQPYTYPHPLVSGVSAPSPTPVYGSCGSTQNSCTSGTLSDTPDSSSQYLWSCSGSNGGSTASCSANIPVQSPTVSGATITAASASYADVSSAVTLAKDGDTVNVPAGTATWSETLTINKSITLQGAGSSLTKISSSNNNARIQIQLPSDKPVRVTGIFFDMVTQASSVDRYAIIIRGPTGTGGKMTQVRIDNNKFNKGSRQVYWLGYSYGVVDHNTFINGDIAVAVSGDEAYAWQRPIEPGSANAVFIEDNTFILDDNNTLVGGVNEQVYHQGGGRSVIRRNTFDGTKLTTDSVWIDSHGYFGIRGQPLIEIYDNTFHSYKTYRMLNLRGGTLIVHDNTAIDDTGFVTFVQLRNEGIVSWGSYDPTDEIKNSYFWNNTMNGVAVNPNIDSASIPYVKLGVNYKNRKPQSGDVYYPYTPYAYPHYLVSGTYGSAQPSTPPSSLPTITDGSTLNVTIDTPIQFNLTQAGTYKLTGSVLAPDTGSNSVFIDIDTNPLNDQSKTWHMGITGSYQMQDVAWNSTNTNTKLWTLSAGTHTLYVNTRESGTRIQSVTFTKTTQTSITPSTKFALNDQVKTTASNLNVRTSPSTSAQSLGTQVLNSLGTIIGGPNFADNLWWWNVNYDLTPDGWSAEDFLNAYTAPTPTPTPPPVSGSCGNNVIDIGEACDGNNVSGYSCSNLPGFKSGGLSCKSDCSGYNVSQCAPGTTTTLNSCDLPTVQSAVNSANNGDTIKISANTCDWTGTLAINNKNVTLSGAGSSATTITKNTNPSNTYQSLITINNSANTPFRITDLTLKSNFTPKIEAMAVYGQAKNWRIDHVNFENFGYAQILINGFTYGVIDNNNFTNNKGVSIDPEESYDDGYSAWSRYPLPVQLGTANAVYIEKNNFLRDGTVVGIDIGETIASNRGGRYVVRQNTFTHTKMNVVSTDHDAHGMCNAWSRGTRSWESYDNIFKIDGNWGKVMFFRGGDGVVFNNTFDFGYNASASVPIELTDYRSNTSSSVSGQCTYGTNPVDGKTYLNLAQGLSYPAPDQIREAYFWNNKDKNGNAVTPYVSGTSFIQAGRDYFNSAKPGYKPYPYPHPIAQFNSSADTTVITPPSTPPIVSSVTALTNSVSATIMWTTNESSDSQVEYGLTTAYGSNTALDTNLVTNHSQGIQNLSPNTTYHFRVRSKDASSNLTTSPDQTLTTLPPPDTDGDGILDTTDKCPATPSFLISQINQVGCPTPKMSTFTLKPNLASVDLTAVPSLELGNSFGKVTFGQAPVPYSLVRDGNLQLDIDTYLQISQGKVTLDSGNLTELNRPATITLYNITLRKVSFRKSNSLCTSCKLISYQNNILVFMVSGFSTYSVEEDTSVEEEPTPVPLSFSLSVSRAGGAKGAVTSTPPGISCGSTCSSSFTSGTSVSLIATPDQDEIFEGWTGACSGSTTCTISMSSDISVTAEFQPKPVPVVVPPSGGGGTRSSSNVTSRPVNTQTTPSVTSYTPTSNVKLTKTLIPGENNINVKNLQIILNTKGFIVSSQGAGSIGKETTYFGPATKVALQRFQCQKLSVCSGSGYGVLDTKTLTSLNSSSPTPVTPVSPTPSRPTTVTVISSTFSRNLSVGSTGEDVRNLQKFLNSKGFTVTSSGVGSIGKEGTRFGPATKTALIKYQVSKGITPASGIFGPKTRNSVLGL